ncbi:unnamed protein product [[Candida] boidinii]|uniref:Unnamed protein product n=1 Tax=Candida boidinii TaxID=5477 RepID=A0A9W6T0P2_CANBO|nr:hypothetical protein BVG19_g1210 [[Candida] boidinii]OWB51161.1 hypothetical protein B5S27_g2720 [[Candida] boidinii]OWB66856.1 hypothetical protein B5S30_g2202 [[Candida] boidinii]OWB83230.1 hypothetical protein B5S33_g1859 [[Candida] boidinii]GME72587.1 unnamed protein product [[Candida] boidinii]
MATSAVLFPVSQYPVPLPENGLLLEYATGNQSLRVPETTVENEISALIKKIESKPGFDKNILFDPKKHLIFKDEYFETTKKFTLDDLKITKTHCQPQSKFGATFPFPLITQEACDMLLYESIQEKILEKYARQPNPSFSKDATGLDFHVCGHIHDSPFTKSFWRCKDVHNIFSKFYGVPVTTMYDGDVGHLNISLASLNNDAAQGKSKEELKLEMEKQNEKQNKEGGDQIPSVLGFHYDSVDFVCVIMLDCGDDMIGGETGIITGDEKTVRIPDPKVGHCTLMQGRVIRHVATKPLTNSNRITLVSGFVPSEVETLDNSVLTTIKPSVLPRTIHDENYSSWFEYRFKRMEAYMKLYRETIVERLNNGEHFDQEEAVRKCKKLELYLRNSWCELEVVSNNPYPPPHFLTPYAELDDYESY